MKWMNITWSRNNGRVREMILALATKEKVFEHVVSDEISQQETLDLHTAYLKLQDEYKVALDHMEDLCGCPTHNGVCNNGVDLYE